MGELARGVQEPRVLVVPEYDETYGPDACQLSAAYGMLPDDWQRLSLDVLLARDSLGRPAAVTAGLSVPRQNGKNAIIEMYELFCLTVLALTIIHTAHEVKTARKAFMRLCRFFENDREYPELAEMVVSIRKTNGQEQILLANGGRIEFSARSKGAARGFTADILIIDEASFITDEQLESIMYAIAASPNDARQIIYAGTPPSQGMGGEVFSRIRKAATEGKTDGRTAWLEWSVADLPPQDTTPEQLVELAYQANPAMGARIDPKFTLTEAMTSTLEGFARERLGWWSPNTGIEPALDLKAWAECETETPPQGGKVAFGIKYSADNSYAAIAAAALEPGGKPHVELLEYRNITSTGIGWIVDFCVQRKDRAAFVLVDGRGIAETTCARLRDSGMPSRAFARCATRDAVAASAGLVNDVRERALTHIEQPALDDAVQHTTKRFIGSGGGFGFGGETPEPVEAVALALWGVKTTKRNPARKLRIG